MRDKSNCCNKKVTAPCLFNVDDILIREAEEVTKVSICFPFTLIAVKKKDTRGGLSTVHHTHL